MNQVRRCLEVLICLTKLQWMTLKVNGVKTAFRGKVPNIVLCHGNEGLSIAKDPPESWACSLMVWLTIRSEWRDNGKPKKKDFGMIWLFFPLVFVILPMSRYSSIPFVTPPWSQWLRGGHHFPVSLSILAFTGTSRNAASCANHLRQGYGGQEASNRRDCRNQMANGKSFV